MKMIYKISIIGLLFASLLIFLLNNILNNVTSEIEKEKEKYEKFIGEKHIINSDTLTIINYSIVDETFTLSNGQKVNYKLIFNEK